MPPADRDIIDFRGERSRHAQFLGREDVLAEIDCGLAAPGAAHGWVLVTGQPGMGKSALLTRWLDLAEKDGRRVPHHFLRRGVADWDRPEAVSRSLAAQVERLYPAQADPEARPERRLLDLLGRVSREVLAPRSERLHLVVDGLDEAAAEAGQNPLPLFLPYALPAGVFALCGSRPTYPHLGWLEARENVQRIDLDEARWSASNELVCRALWGHWAPAFQPPLDAGFVDRALAAGSGNVLYAVKLREWLSAQPAGERRVSVLPRGLEGLLDQAWADLRRLPKEQRDVAVGGLGVLCAAREALPLSAVEEAAGWAGGDAREDFLSAVRPFLLEEPEHWAGAAAYRPYHESFREFVGEKVGPKAMREHHGRLLATVAAWPSPSDERFAHRYALRHAVLHAVAAGDHAKAGVLCRDVGFLEGWCREGGVEAIEEGLKAAGEALGEDEIATLHQVVRAESHWLRKEPEAMAELVYNRLRSTGWEAPRIAQRLRFSGGLPPYRLRHPVRMGWERTLMGHTDTVNACVVTPDGRRIVSASDDRTLRVWDLASGRELAVLQGHAGAVRGCAVTPDGLSVVSASDDGTLKRWDASSGREVATFRGHGDRVNACAVTPDGLRVVSASWDKTLKVWDLSTGLEITTLEGHTRRVWACAVTPDGRYAVSAAEDNTLRVWDLASGHLHAKLDGLTYWVGAFGGSDEGSHLVYASDPRTLSFYDVETARTRRVLEGDTLWIHGGALAATPGALRAVSAWGKTLTVWDVRRGSVLATLAGHDTVVKAFAITPDGLGVVSGAYGGKLKVWDLTSTHVPPDRDGHTALVTACAVAPDGLRVVSASDDKTLKVWAASSGRVLATLEAFGASVTGCAVTADGLRIVSSSADARRVWDLASGREITAGSEDGFLALEATLDGRPVASASGEIISCHGNTLQIQDPATHGQLATIHGVGLFRCVAAAAGLLVAGDAAGNVWILDTPSSTPPPRVAAPAPLHIFYSYSPADDSLRAALETALANLQRQGLIAPWSARLIPAGGGPGDREVDARLEQADVILLLVSADFIASDYCYEKEMTRALARHRAGEARVLPILVRPGDYVGTPFADLPALPSDGRPVTSWPDRDEAWLDVAKGIRRAIDELRSGRRA